MTREAAAVLAVDAAETASAAARAAPAMFLQLTSARAERDAKRAEANHGPLAGVPFAVKDVFDISGTRTSGASQLFDRRPPASADAEAVHRMAESGAVCIGKTTLSELAYSGLGVNDRFGTPTFVQEGREHLVGGSSSGSAAAVRAGIVPVALGSDTSGSTRVPAAWAGVFGFRPSIGRYPDEGMLSLAPTLDTVGIIATDAATLLAVDAVLARDLRPSKNMHPMTLAVPHDEYLVGCDSAVLERFYMTIDGLRALGLSVERRRFESLDVTRELHTRHLAIVEAEALAAYGIDLDRHPMLFTPAMRRRLERARLRGREHSAEPLRAAMPTLRAKFRQELGNAILMSPPTEIDSPTLRHARESAETEDALNARALKLTMALSYLNSPSAVMPVGISEELGGPAWSLQFSAHSGADHRVLAAVSRVDALTGPRGDSEARSRASMTTATQLSIDAPRRCSQ